MFKEQRNMKYWHRQKRELIFERKKEKERKRKKVIKTEMKMTKVTGKKELKN